MENIPCNLKLIVNKQRKKEQGRTPPKFVSKDKKVCVLCVLSFDERLLLREGEDYSISW